MIHDILTRRYGDPAVVERDDFLEHHWNNGDESTRCILMMGNPETPLLLEKGHPLRKIYGKSVGGFLIGDALKVAMIVAAERYGLYSINELRQQPEVQKALAVNASIHFFMDAANTWFYGENEGRLFVFDRETEELEDLGAFDIAFQSILDEWVSA